MTDITERLLRMVPMEILGGKPTLLNPDGVAAVEEINRLRGVIDRMIISATKWDTSYVDPDGKTHYSRIGELFAEDLRNIARAALEGK